jgi:hypothetical protein
LHPKCNTSVQSPCKAQNLPQLLHISDEYLNLTRRSTEIQPIPADMRLSVDCLFLKVTEPSSIPYGTPNLDWNAEFRNAESRFSQPLYQ